MIPREPRDPEPRDPFSYIPADSEIILKELLNRLEVIEKKVHALEKGIFSEQEEAFKRGTGRYLL